MSNLRLFLFIFNCSRVFAIARVIVALPKKLVICEKQNPILLASGDSNLNILNKTHD